MPSVRPVHTKLVVFASSVHTAPAGDEVIV